MCHIQSNSLHQCFCEDNLSGKLKIQAFKATRHSPPHGVGDADGGAKEGGEAEQRDEDGGHLADSVGLPGCLAVVHDAAL